MEPEGLYRRGDQPSSAIVPSQPSLSSSSSKQKYNVSNNNLSRTITNAPTQITGVKESTPIRPSSSSLSTTTAATNNDNNNNNNNNSNNITAPAVSPNNNLIQPPAANIEQSTNTSSSSSGAKRKRSKKNKVDKRAYNIPPNPHGAIHPSSPKTKKYTNLQQKANNKRRKQMEAEARERKAARKFRKAFSKAERRQAEINAHAEGRRAAKEAARSAKIEEAAAAAAEAREARARALTDYYELNDLQPAGPNKPNESDARVSDMRNRAKAAAAAFDAANNNNEPSLQTTTQPFTQPVSGSADPMFLYRYGDSMKNRAATISSQIMKNSINNSDELVNNIRGGGFDFSDDRRINDILQQLDLSKLEGDNSENMLEVFLSQIEEIFDSAGLKGITRDVYFCGAVGAEMDRVANTSLDKVAAKFNMLKLFRHMSDIIKARCVPKVDEINEPRSPLSVVDEYDHVLSYYEAKDEVYKMYELKCHERPDADYLFGIEASSIGGIIVVSNGMPVEVAGPDFCIELSFQEPVLYLNEGVDTSVATLDGESLTESRILSNGHILKVNGFTYELVVTCSWSIIPSNSISRISKRDRNNEMAEELTGLIGSKLFSAGESLSYAESFFTDHPHELPDDKTHLTNCYRNAMACTMEALQNLHILRCMQELDMHMDKKYRDLIEQHFAMYNSIENTFKSIDWWRLGYEIGGTVSAEDANDVTLMCPPNIDPVVFSSLPLESKLEVIQDELESARQDHQATREKVAGLLVDMAAVVEWRASSIMEIDQEVVIPHGDSSSEDDEEDSDAGTEEADDETVVRLPILLQMSAQQRKQMHDAYRKIFELVRQAVATKDDCNRNHGKATIHEGQKGVECIHCNAKLFHTGDVAEMIASSKLHTKVVDAMGNIKKHILRCKKVPQNKKDWFNNNKDPNGSKAKAYYTLNETTRLSVEEYADLLGMQKFIPVKLNFDEMCREAKKKLEEANVLETASEHRPLHEVLIMEEEHALRELLQGLQSRFEMSALDPRKKQYGKSWYKEAFEKCGQGKVQEFYPAFNKQVKKNENRYMKKPIVHLFKWLQNACAECNEKKTDKRYGGGGYDGNHVLDDYLKQGQTKTKRFGMSKAHFRNVITIITEALVNYETCPYCHNRHSKASSMSDDEIESLKQARKVCSGPYAPNTDRERSVAMVLDSIPGKSFVEALHGMNETQFTDNNTISLVHDANNNPVEMELEDLILPSKTVKKSKNKFLDKLLMNGTKNMCGGCARCEEGKGTDSMNLAPRYKHGLEFHHIFDPSKLFNPSTCASLEAKIAELKKCILLCRSCHFYISYIPSERKKFDKWVRENNIYYYDDKGNRQFLDNHTRQVVYEDDEEDSDGQEEWRNNYV